MKLIPNSPCVETTGTERRVFSLLRNVDWGGVTGFALHSLNLAEHEYQRWGEIDFLVVGTKGLIAIEVKGGSLSCSNGQWCYEDRMGRVVRRSKSPIVQAKDAFFSLDKKYLGPALGRNFALDAPAGFCVILAGMARKDIDHIIGGPELPAALVGTREDVANPASLQKFLTRVAMYWSAKNRSKGSIQADDVKRILQLLRPEFERVRSLALTREQLGIEIKSLTSEQYSIIDHWEGAKRILCSSAAGCGKTLLAVEMVRRLRASGEKVIFVVGSNSLADALRSSLDLDGVVLGLDDLDSLSLKAKEKTSTLIIDEGQQLLTRRQLDILDATLEGGLASGRWVWFGDQSYQSSLPEVEARECFEALTKMASVAPRLTRNCRNTPEIISSVELASGVPLGHAKVRGRGLHPRFVEADSLVQAASIASNQVHQWNAEEIPIANMALLTDNVDSGGLAALVASQGKLSVEKWRRASASSNALNHSCIDDFRGLEAGFLIMWIGDDDLNDESLGRALYLGMTRANFSLLVIATPKNIARIKGYMADNALRPKEMASVNY
ncbi:NERD domain-containing protein [Stenotrophomonas maltophilia]|nr:NERD domain-containing protein [Stenotrophomonas geniculata]MCI1091305.1 NERD domain-containing protein [Stenotrophomonas maltophilia]MCI1129435.1 NERD domain-containing protein [Stenotrophomonas maltophilia]